MQSVRVSKRKRWIFVGSCWFWSWLTSISPPNKWMYNLTQFLSLTLKNLVSQHDLPTTSNRNSLARKVEGLELDIAVCIARLGGGLKVGMWMFHFFEIVNMKGEEEVCWVKHVDVWLVYVKKRVFLIFKLRVWCFLFFFFRGGVASFEVFAPWFCWGSNGLGASTTTYSRECVQDTWRCCLFLACRYWCPRHAAL